MIPDRLLDVLELDLHLLPQLEIERAERLVEQQHAGPVDERARERDALALSARELARLAAGERVQPHERERLDRTLAPLRLGDALDAQAVLDVLLHGHVREERVVLEHRVDVALVGRAIRHILPAEQHAAARGPFEARDHAQTRGLARPGRPEQREELAAPDVEVDCVDGDERAEMLRHAVQPDAHVTGGRTRAGAPDRRGLLHGCATIAARLAARAAPRGNSPAAASA